MKKIFSILSVILVFLLAACSNSNDMSYPETTIDGVSSERLIVYTVNFTLYSDDYSDVIDAIDNIEVDMWYSEKVLYDTSAYLSLRVETSKLDFFVEELKEYDLCNYSIKATDITNSYYDLESDKLRLQTEYDRLLELMENATMEEIVGTINPRLFEIEQEINNINKQLTEFDSSLLYSYVNIRVYNNTEKDSYFSAIGSAFIYGFGFIGNLFYYGSIALVFFLPIILLIGVPAGIVFFIVYKKKTKNK